MRRLAAALAALLLLTAVTLTGVRPVDAEPLADGITAADAGDYATALRLWRPLANSGNANAESYLGRMYLNGWGLPKDYAQAAYWYRKAAEQGNREAAENNLGPICAFTVSAFTRTMCKRSKWFQKAAAQGALEAFMNLPETLDADGHGVCATGLFVGRELVP